MFIYFLVKKKLDSPLPHFHFIAGYQNSPPNKITPKI